MGEHLIQYNIFLGARLEPGSLFRGYDDVNHYFLRNIGVYPRSFEQLAFGFTYYQHNQLLMRPVGYYTIFCYADTMESYCNRPDYFSDCSARVNMICAEDEQSISIICKGLEIIHQKSSIYLVDKAHAGMFNFPNVCTSCGQVIDCLKQIMTEVLPNEELTSLPKIAEKIDKGFLFSPSKNNTLTLNNIIGDFGYALRQFSPVDIIFEQTTARLNSDTFERQQILSCQVHNINELERNVYVDAKEVYQKMIDQISAPWIIILPYTSPDVRTVLKNTSKYADKQIAKIFKKILDIPNTKNYTFNIEDQEQNPKKAQLYQYALELVFGPRMKALDVVGALHASFRFSPYLRLPMLGHDINDGLSLFSRQNVENFIGNKGYKDSLGEQMEKLGKRIQEATLSEQMEGIINDFPRQIVAVSDLPIEWTIIKDVPLSFTHDICRIPEVPIGGGMAHYEINLVQNFVVDSDIMNDTLIVFGCNETGFLSPQQECMRMSKKMGFHTAYCLNADSFYDIIHRCNTKFLIIDTHGSVDSTTQQSYIYMGNDKIYPQDIVDHHVNVPIVFISACITTPVYNISNKIANGFIESGSLAVTSTYVPIPIDDASFVYLSLLNNLYLACQKPVFSNWAAFVSYILRESYIRSAYPSTLSTQELQSSYEELCRDVKMFNNRRKIYKALKEGFEMSGYKINAPKIPHYLMYSTIGRADLIKFTSFMNPYIADTFQYLQDRGGNIVK